MCAGIGACADAGVKTELKLVHHCSASSGCCVFPSYRLTLHWLQETECVCKSSQKDQNYQSVPKMDPG